MNWEEISKEPELSEEFMREHAKQLEWMNILETQTISESFREEMFNHIMFAALKSDEGITLIEPPITKIRIKDKSLWGRL